MNEKKISFILKAFGMNLPVTEWKPFGHGHINDTYLIKTTDEVPDFILQRKNHLVFRNVDGMMNNIMLVTNHVKKQLMVTGQKEVERKVMTYITDPANRPYVQDEEGNFWTLCLFISGSHGIEEVTHPDQAFSAGKAFGHFQLQLADLPGSLLIETIPGFHNGKLRFSQLKDSIKNNAAGRVDAMTDVISRLLERADEMVQLQDWLDNGDLPLRITHNDTKINNVMFDDKNQILCIIDLDTVMPGSVLFDFGDAIRTLGNTAPEDEPDLTRIAFNRDYYKAFAEGYMSESGKFLTQKERDNLAFGCRYMVWEQAIRFLADYLNGDTYYKIGYPEHNRVRTEAQLRYLEVMEENYAYMKSVTGH